MNDMRKIWTIAIFCILAATGICYASWSLDWTGEAGFEDDGVEPDEGPNGSYYEFRVRFNPNEQKVLPYWVKLFVDLNGDGKFSDDEVFEAEPDPKDPSIWSVRRILRIDPSLRPHLAYYFQAFADNKIKSSQLRFGPKVSGYSRSFVIEGKGWYLQEALLPMEIRTMKERDRMIFINTSNSPQRLAISIPESGPFFPHPDKETEEANAFVMSVIITNTDREFVSQEEFNQEGSEDVISLKPREAKGPVFGANGVNAGEKIMPGESVAIWMQLRAPAYAFGVETNEQWINIKIEVVPTE